MDFSATPFYIRGSGYEEGAPFPWIVSDFGLVGAIESGIVKIPRVPVDDNTGALIPKYFRLWEKRLQATVYEIAAELTRWLKEKREEWSARHVLFPQVLEAVWRYIEERVILTDPDTPLEEIALLKYKQRIIERLTEAIEPDTEAGEPPLLPVIERFRPIGSTSEVLFRTARSCVGTTKSHISHVVLDAPSWEHSVAYQLEQIPEVIAYARNGHLDFVTPHERRRRRHEQRPDWRLPNQGWNAHPNAPGRLGFSEEFLNALLSVVEDAFQGAAYIELVDKLSKPAEGQAVAHLVHKACAAVFRDKAVGVVPESVRTTKLDVYKQVRRVVGGDVRCPAYRYPHKPDGIVDEGALVHGDRRRRQEPKIQLRWRNASQVFRALKKRKDLRERSGHPLFTVEAIELHGANLSSETRRR